MSEDKRHAHGFYAVSFPVEETPFDDPALPTGQLIPPGPLSFTPATITRLPARTKRPLLSNQSYLLLASLLALAVLGVGVAEYGTEGARLMAAVRGSSVPTPEIVIEHPYTKERVSLTNGASRTFSEPNFFDSAREGFIAAEQTFIEADLAAMVVRYFERGVLHSTFPIIGKGEEGTFWETPAGLYEVELKKQKHYSQAGDVYLPYSINFQGNFYVHGEPQRDGVEATDAPVPQGGIRLADADAAALYSYATLGMPILVYDRPTVDAPFLYEPKVPTLATPQYLIADIKSGTILAADNLDTPVPIASLTKLMTAVVAAEYINLDSRVSTVAPTFVQSLIPRLADRSSVSLYSLLELLLLESSNEAAEVIAAEVGRQKFITFMNERAESLGMSNTVFTDPSGLDAGNVSTVSDLLRLLQYIHEKRRFIIDLSAGTPLPEMYVSREFAGLHNFNTVADLENFVGGKIGETTAAKQTSATLHTLTVRGEERILAIIILGSEGRTADVQALMQYAEERYGG